jgi:hypothetical protein
MRNVWGVKQNFVSIDVRDGKEDSCGKGISSNVRTCWVTALYL